MSALFLAVPLTFAASQPERFHREMSMSENLLMSLLGIAVVFAALTSIIVIIKGISALAAVIDKKPQIASVGAGEPAVESDLLPVVPSVVNVSNMVAAKGSLGDVALFDTDDKTAAMVMAIVADELKAPLNELRFISIKQKT